MIVRETSQSQLRLGFMGTLLGDENLNGLNNQSNTDACQSTTLAVVGQILVAEPYHLPFIRSNWGSNLFAVLSGNCFTSNLDLVLSVPDVLVVLIFLA
jgi:hypothetical protein